MDPPGFGRRDAGVVDRKIAQQQAPSLDTAATQANAALATEELRKQGLAPISLRPCGLWLPLVRPGKRFPATLFSIELMSLLDIGHSDHLDG